MRRSLHLHFVKFDISSDQLDLDTFLDRLYANNDLTRSGGFTRTALSLDLAIDEPSSAFHPPPRAIFAETNLCGGRCYYADGVFVAGLDGDYSLRIVYDVRAA